MYNRALRGVLVCSLALWTVAAFVSPDESVSRSPAIVMVSDTDQSCGPEPVYSDNPSVDLTAEWYSYGDCSGWYGPIDAVGAVIPDMDVADDK